MQEKNSMPADDTSGNNSETSPQKMISPEDDGRSKEWQDRARVNTEQVPEGTKTILERDFEPEQPANKQAGTTSTDGDTPAY